MKRLYRLCILAVILVTAACAPRERTIVLLSTNDMHARIQEFARLATAVEACRDTTELVLLVDAGDRWSGNAFVDRAPVRGWPIIELMNRLGYDAATLGNHDFDFRMPHLMRMIDSMDFEVVCANVVSDTTAFAQIPPYVIVEADGLRIGFVGVVTNYENGGYPAGQMVNFEGVHFPDPQQKAVEYAELLRPQCDVLVLLSHMGDDRDVELLGKTTLYDLVVGGHTHEQINKHVNGTLLTQTGKNLRNIGVTEIRMRGKKRQSVDYRLIPLSEYTPDPSYQRQVDTYYADPALNAAIGELAAAATKSGLANWMADAVKDEADAEIGIFHIGNVRLEGMPAGSVSESQVFDLEPFGAYIAEMEMTPADMRRMIVSKYNDPVNTKEAHRIDLISTTPYTIVTDASDNAVDVIFPELKEGRRYSIAVSDYVFLNYNDLNYTNGRITDDLVTDILIEELHDDSPLRLDNTPRQKVVIRK